MAKVLADLVIAVDATNGNKNVIRALKIAAIDLLNSFCIKNGRNSDLQYGVVVFRDPVTNVGRVTDPGDVNEFIDFKTSTEDVEEWLDNIKVCGGHDEPEDWAGALDIALNQMTWRKDAKKLLIWLGDADAHGDDFSATQNSAYNAEGARFEGLLKEAAKRRIYMSVLNVRKNGGEGCEKTANRIRRIYEDANGPAVNVADLEINITAEMLTQIAEAKVEKFKREHGGKTPEQVVDPETYIPPDDDFDAEGDEVEEQLLVGNLMQTMSRGLDVLADIRGRA